MKNIGLILSVAILIFGVAAMTYADDLEPLGSGQGGGQDDGPGGGEGGGHAYGHGYGSGGSGSAVTPVPEPATCLLIGSGLAGFIAIRKKFKKD